MLTVLFNYDQIYEELRKIHQSLEGVLGTNYNLRIEIETTTGIVIFDPETDNYTKAKSQTIEIKAQVIQKDNNSNQTTDIYKDTELNTISTYVIGHIVEPIRYDGYLNNTGDLKCYFKENDLWLERRFKPIDKLIPNSLEASSINYSIGQSIRGYIYDIKGVEKF